MFRILTRGLIGGAGELVTSGLGSVVAEVVRIIRGGRSSALRTLKDVADSFKISAMLIHTNGKEIATPIFNSVARKFSSENDILVKVKTKKITINKPRLALVKVNSVLVRNKKNERN